MPHATGDGEFLKITKGGQTDTRKWLSLLIILVAATTSCVSPEVDDDTVPEFSTDTVMGLIQERGSLRVAIDPHLGPPWSTPVCPQNKQVVPSRTCLAPEPEGFLIDFAREVAASLGVEAEFDLAPSPYLLAHMEPETSTYDLAFPAVPITEEVVRDHTFANPYYVAHQRLLAASESGVDSPEDLVSLDVCMYLEAETGVDLTDLNPAVDATSLPAPFCGLDLVEGDADLATAADIYLIQWKDLLDRCPPAVCRRDRDFEIVGNQLTTEGFAPMVEEAATGMAEWVSAVLGEAKNEGRYMQWYEEWIAPYLSDPITEPPTMTIEEAAALFPTNIE